MNAFERVAYLVCAGTCAEVMKVILLYVFYSEL